MQPQAEYLALGDVVFLFAELPNSNCPIKGELEHAWHAHIQQTSNGRRGGRGLEGSGGRFKPNMAAGKDVEESAQNKR